MNGLNAFVKTRLIGDHPWMLVAVARSPHDGIETTTFVACDTFSPTFLDIFCKMSAARVCACSFLCERVTWMVALFISTLALRALNLQHNSTYTKDSSFVAKHNLFMRTGEMSFS